MFDSSWNSFLFKLKQEADSELLEIAKNSKIEIEDLETNFNSTKVSYNILVDRICYEQFENHIDHFKELAELHFQNCMEESYFIGQVTIQVNYEPFVDWDAIRGTETKKSLIDKIKFEQNILLGLIAGDNIAIESEYIDLNKHLIKCSKAIGIEYPNKLNSYAEINAMFYQVAYGTGAWQKRRGYVRRLYNNTINTLENSIDDKESLFEVYEPTGWASIDRDINLLKAYYHRAENQIEYKAVANMVRDILIKVAQEVYVDIIHHPEDFTEEVSTTDFRRMLDGYFNYKYNGNSKKEYRLLARKTMDVVNKLVHSDSTEKYHLTMCLEVSLMVIRLVKLTENNIDV